MRWLRGILPWIIVAGCLATVLMLTGVGVLTDNWWPLILSIGAISLIGLLVERKHERS